MSILNNEFGDRMKLYENIEARRRFVPLLPIIVRLDGKCFSSWTRGLKRPYDPRMIELMTLVTKKLVKETNAVIGYTQSDEISLILYSDDIIRPVYFDGRISKIISVLSSVATYWFNQLKMDVELDENITAKPAFFDCRAWTVPNLTEAVNSILWRELDATRNSVNSAARSVYSHDELHGATKAEVMDMLMDKGINWNDYPSSFKRGVYVQKRNVLGNSNEITVLDLPPLNTIENRVDVIFKKQDIAC